MFPLISKQTSDCKFLLSKINLKAKAEPKASPSGFICPVIKLDDSPTFSNNLLIFRCPV